MRTIAPLTALDPALERRVTALLTASGIPGGVVAVVRGGDGFVGAHGRRARDRDEPVTPDTAFDVGSCSKSYVATAVARLVSDGRIGFDQPVKPIVPELELDDPEITAAITVRDLLCNRTGLKRQVPVESFANPDIRVEHIAARLRHLDRQVPFRQGYVYFNPGFMVAALVVERVSGMPYQLFLENELFGPLGMTHSASGLRPFAILDDRAVGHAVVDGDQRPVRDEPVFDNWQGAAGVFSSGRDATRWLGLHLGLAATDLIDGAVLAELQRPHTRIPNGECKLIHKPPEAGRCDYCLGWWTTDLGGHRLVQHAGEMFGWRAHTALLPDDRIGVAVYTNSSARPVHQLASYTILESLLAGTARDWWAEGLREREELQQGLVHLFEQSFPCTEREPSPVPLERYAGRYRHAACGDLVVEAVGHGSLALRFVDGRLWDTRLSHLGGSVFRGEFERSAVRDYLLAPFRARFEIDGDRVVALEDVQARYVRVG